MTMVLENIDYSKLSPRGLKDLINQGDVKAEQEYSKRVHSGEIKTRRVTFEDIRKMYNKKAS